MSVLAVTEPSCRAVSAAGGKGASLARMTELGLPVPPAFVVEAGELERVLGPRTGELRALLAAHAPAEAARQAQALVLAAELPADLVAEIDAGYAALSGAGGGGEARVAVRSSACAEDSDAASYAGQQETYLHVRGADEVRERIRECWASFFSERALFYRSKKGKLSDLGMAVVVQRMVEAEVAGVLFTVDPVAKRRDRMVVEAVLGLGEAVVSGEVTPDHYVMRRDGTVKRAKLAQQPYAIVRGPDGGTIKHPLSPEAGAAAKVSDDHLRALARLGSDLEQRLGGPQDIEWALEGGELFVLQARPVTA